MLVKFVQFLIDSLVNLLNLILSFLPISPFKSVYNLTLDNTLLSNLAWIVPFPQIIGMLQAWTTAIGIYYLYSIVLRWIKAVS